LEEGDDDGAPRKVYGSKAIAIVSEVKDDCKFFTDRFLHGVYTTSEDYEQAHVARVNSTARYIYSAPFIKIVDLNRSAFPCPLEPKHVSFLSHLCTMAICGCLYILANEQRVIKKLGAST
jgi:hypothetical protein